MHFSLFFLVTVISLVWIKQIDARHYQHSKAELALTNEILIDQPDCKAEMTPILVHTAAVSSGKYHDRRMAIRRTWAREAANYKMRVIFVIGQPRNAAEQRFLNTEASKYEDLLQFAFTDDYYNLTLKSIAELKWAEKHCNTSNYVIKSDDDVLLNLPQMSQLLVSGKVPSGFTGLMFHTPAYRQPGYKWYMPRRYYTQNNYQFLLGFSYILSTDKLTTLLDAISNYEGPVLDIDDVFLTGVMADFARIKRHNSGLFRFYCGIDACVAETCLAMTCSNTDNSERLYRTWKQSNIDRCYANYGFAPSGRRALRGF